MDVAHFIHENKEFSVAVVTLIGGGFVGWVSGLFRWIKEMLSDSIKHRRERKAREFAAANSVTLVQNKVSPLGAFWAEGKKGDGTSGIHATLTLKATNLHSADIHLVDFVAKPLGISARLKRPRTDAVTVLVQTGPQTVSEEAPIPRGGHPVDVTLSFFLSPTFLRAGDQLHLDLVVTDSRGHKHRLRGLIVPSMNPKG